MLYFSYSKRKEIKNMLFIIKKASDMDYTEKRVFNSLEELMTFKKEIGHSVIITRAYDAKSGNDSNILLIYDDYLE
jgi:hypothetical protein